MRATAGRSNTRAGGLPRVSAAPRTLRSVGATEARCVTGALATISRVTRTAERDTDCDCTKAVAGTATIAPFTCWLA